MDKAEETRYFRAVMPADWVAGATPSESPDFVCSDEKGPFLGVEVTELFASESEARFHKIPDYPVEILKSGAYRHRDDVTTMPVGTFTWTRDGLEHKVPALVRKPPRLNERINHLANTIQKKGKKLAQYQRIVAETDLLLVDRGGLFNRLKFDEAARLVHEKEIAAAIRQSEFREIWLVINTDPKPASIPCHVNLLAQELGSFHNAVKELIDEKIHRISISSYLMMLSGFLDQRGLGNASVFAGTDKYAVFSRGVGCFVPGPRLELFPVTPRVTPQMKLGEEVHLINPDISDPAYESIYRKATGYGLLVSVAEAPQIQF